MGGLCLRAARNRKKKQRKRDKRKGGQRGEGEEDEDEEGEEEGEETGGAAKAHKVRPSVMREIRRSKRGQACLGGGSVFTLPLCIPFSAQREKSGVLMRSFDGSLSCVQSDHFTVHDPGCVRCAGGGEGVSQP